MTFISPAQVGLEESDRAGFQFDSVDKLLQTPAPIDWVIKGFLPTKTLFMTFGNPESGKSLLSLDMALHIVLGLPWCGKKVKQGAVFYLAGEGHYGLSRRVKAFAEHHQIDLTGKPLFLVDLQLLFWIRDQPKRWPWRFKKLRKNMLLSQS